MYPNSIVWPMVPGPERWRANSVFLKLLLSFITFDTVVARGPYSTLLALGAVSQQKVKVVFDARGAYHAELNEYDVAGSLEMKMQIGEIEKKALYGSTFRIAVSQKLVEYWRSTYEYQGNEHVVIPCTLSESKVALPMSRSILGFSEQDIIIAYSGSDAGWQSTQMLNDILLRTFEADRDLKLLYMAPKVPADSEFFRRYADRIVHKWFSPDEVRPALAACDYGWLVREDSVTNRVSSPVKFAEYLSSGLQILISADLGDYSEFVRKHNAGKLVDKTDTPVLRKTSEEERRNNVRLAFSEFVKKKYIEEYKRAFIN